MDFANEYKRESADRFQMDSDRDVSVNIEVSGHSDPEVKKKKKKKDKEKKKDKGSDKKKESRKDNGAPSSSRKLKDPPPVAGMGFDDRAFDHGSSDFSDGWAAFDGARKRAPKGLKHDHCGWESSHDSGLQFSNSTQATEAMTSDGSESRDFTLASIEVETREARNQPYLVPDADNPMAVAVFHSEMLHGFLKRNGHDASMAVATAAAFEVFLKQQQDVLTKLQGGDGSVFPPDLDEDDRLDHLESLADEEMVDSFAPDSIWDDESGIFDEKARMMAEYMEQNDFKILEPSQRSSFSFDEKALLMAEYMQNEQFMTQAPDPDNEAEELAAYHGEMLHDYLHRHGKPDAVAEHTASAFQDFLKRQEDALNKLSLNGGSPSSSIDELSRGAQSEPSYQSARLGGIPGVVSPDYDSQDRPDSARRGEQFVRRTSGISMASGASGTSDGSGMGKSRNHLVKIQSEYSSRTDFPAIDDRKPAPYRERPVQVQMASLTNSQLACVDLIRKQSKGRFNDALCLRMARCSDFKAKAALKVMKKFSPNMLQISIANMEKPLRSQLVYPLPGVVGQGGINMFYMRFSRLFPRSMPIPAFSELLVYVMNCLHEQEENCVNGVGLIADLTDFTMTNFSIPYMTKFLMLVQGRLFPVKVESLLFVNAPKWFGTIWGALKQMMSTDFLKTNVHRVSLNEMVKHLEPGWEPHMTDDVFLGTRKANEIVAEFIQERKEVESARILGGNNW